MTLEQMVKQLLERNGGPVDGDTTVDGHGYVLVRREDFDALAAWVARLVQARDNA